jgi:hypothetical protein
VKEEIASFPRVNETKTLVRNLLNRAFCHLQSNSEKLLHDGPSGETGSGTSTSRGEMITQQADG